MDDVLRKYTKYKGEENSVLLQNYILRLSLQFFNGGELKWAGLRHEAKIDNRDHNRAEDVRRLTSAEKKGNWVDLNVNTWDRCQCTWWSTVQL